jgi:lipopolysaccharide export LptBFGC system permease protein LptF
MELMAKMNVSWNTLLLIDMLQLPLSIVYCLPPAVVCAAALVWIRQCQSSEILALQVCGISRRRILAPFLVIGLIAGGAELPLPCAQIAAGAHQQFGPAVPGKA